MAQNLEKSIISPLLSDTTFQQLLSVLIQILGIVKVKSVGFFLSENLFGVQDSDLVLSLTIFVQKPKLIHYHMGGNLLTVQSIEMMSYLLFFWPLFSAI